MAREIKSTLELALEKIADLPRLTDEELRQQQEDEYRPRGEALATRFLSGEVADSSLEAELGRWKEGAAEIVRRSFLMRLCRAMPLGDEATALRVFTAVEAVCGGSGAEALARYRQLAQSFRQLRQRERTSVEQAERERLAAAGISGSAVRVDLADNPSWLRRERELLRELEPALDRLKRELLDAVLEPGRSGEAADAAGGRER
ncbi:MAG: hypothetical protein JXR83_23240 [Deltaproteobacteria bacterium]|nr:hypothetical protein [Deltaproteobacteria bacterium]